MLLRVRSSIFANRQGVTVVTYVINLCWRAKGNHDYAYLGEVDVGEPLTSEHEQTIKLPPGREVRVRIDHCNIVPVHPQDAEGRPVFYLTEL
jgi:hypothetical protein